MVAVHFHLVDRLVGAAVAQFGRAIGGEQQQRHAGLTRFDGGGVKFGGGRAGAADERDGALGRQRVAEREEAGRALVQVQKNFDVGVLVKGKRQRRGARAGRDANGAQAAVGQRVDKAAGEVEVGVCRHINQGKNRF